jgi:hypothetical protein
LNGAGVKRMKFTDGSGKDTVNMNTSGVDAKINFGDNAKVSYTIDNNSLNVNHSYTKDGVTSDNTVVLNNLFSNKTDSSLTVGNDVLTVGKEQVTKKSTRNLLQVSDSTKTNFDITGSKNADHIITGAGNDVISSGKGNDIVNAGDGNNTLVYTSGVDNYTAGNGDDTYNVNFGKSTDLVITDNGGNDVLNLLGKGLSSDNLSLLFNVTKSTTEPIDSESSLFIFDNSKFTTKNVLSMVSNDHASGSVSLENYFTTGKIETVNVGSDAETATTWDFSTKINQITQAVQSWLNDYGYVDAMEVFESKNSTDMSSLLNVYSTGSYTSTQTAEQQVLPTT